MGACQMARGRTASLLLPGPTDFLRLPCAIPQGGKIVVGLGAGFRSAVRYRSHSPVGNSLGSNVFQPTYVAAGVVTGKVFFHVLCGRHSPLRLDGSLPIFDRDYSPGQVGNEVLRCRGGVNTFEGCVSLHLDSLHFGISAGVDRGKMHVDYRERYFPPDIADRRFDFTSIMRSGLRWLISLGWSLDGNRAFWLTFVTVGKDRWRNVGMAPADWSLPGGRRPREIHIGVESLIPSGGPGDQGRSGHVISEITIKLVGDGLANFLNDVRRTDAVKPGLRCGVEMPVSRKLNAFAGFILNPSDYPRCSDTVAFSSGVSIPFHQAAFRVGAEIAWRNFPEEEGGILEGIVEEKVIRISSEIIFYR